MIRERDWGLLALRRGAAGAGAGRGDAAGRPNGGANDDAVLRHGHECDEPRDDHHAGGLPGAPGGGRLPVQRRQRQPGAGADRRDRRSEHGRRRPQRDGAGYGAGQRRPGDVRVRGAAGRPALLRADADRHERRFRGGELTGAAGEPGRVGGRDRTGGAGAADELALLEGTVETMRGRLEAAAQEHAAQEAARRELVAAISTTCARRSRARACC